ncbi:MAG: hypothetical protein IVW36_02370 [Dehalococcoidia bacterium]|nr:hypothetical protein [Dehalococcoidia bacterium]
MGEWVVILAVVLLLIAGDIILLVAWRRTRAAYRLLLSGQSAPMILAERADQPIDEIIAIGV